MCKKLIAFMMLIMMIFSAGCSKSKPDKPVKQKGGYVEEMLTIYAKPVLPGELFLMNGEPAFIDMPQKRRYFYTEDGFKFEDFPSLYSLGPRVEPYEGACSSDGEYFMSYYDHSVSQNIQYARILSDGEIIPFELGNIYLQYFEYSSNGRLFACGADLTIYEINLDAKTANPLFNCETTISAFDVVNNYIITVDSNDTYFYDLESNQIADTPEAIRSFIKEQGFSSETESTGLFAYDFCSGEDNSFYIASKNGLYRYVMNGNQIEQLIDGISCHLGNPSFTMNSVLCKTDGTFLITYREGSVMSYHYDPDVITEISSSLKIYSLTENDTLSQIISEYKNQHPTVKIDYEIGMRSGVTYDDALKNLTTEMLSKNAPDVIMLDGMDIDNYIEKNMLTDLSEYESVFNPGNNLLDNVAKWNNKDSLYSVACKFRLPMLIADKEDMQQISDLKTLSQAAQKRIEKGDKTKPIFALNTNDTIETALLYEGNKLLTKDGVDAENITQFFESCKAIYDTGHDTDYLYYSSYEQPRCYELWTAATQIVCGELEIALGTANGFTYDLNFVTSLDTADNKNTLEYRYGLSDNHHTFVPTCNLSISSASKNKKAAAEFLAIALSEDLQMLELKDGFPVNTAALEKFYKMNEDSNNNKGQAFGLEDKTILTMMIEWMTNAEVAEFQKAITALNTPVIFDTMTKDIIIQAGIQCLEGDLSPEQAASEVSGQLNLRIKE